MASVRIAQTNREKTLADFAKYKADSAEKELLMNVTRLEEQLIREFLVQEKKNSKKSLNKNNLLQLQQIEKVKVAEIK